MSAPEIPTKGKLKDGKIEIEIGASDDLKNEMEGNFSTEEDKDAKIADLEAKLEMIAEAQFQQKKKELGAPSELETIEELEAWKEGRESNKPKNPDLNPELGSGGSGKAPLSGEPTGQISHVKEYADYGEMIKDLNERARSDNAEVREEAKEILDKLHAKAVKTRNVPFEKEIDLGALIKDKKRKARERGEILEHWRDY